MLMYIMLYIMLAYVMMCSPLFNDACLHNAYFWPLILANAFCFHSMSCVTDTACLLQILIRILHIAFNLVVFLI